MTNVFDPYDSFADYAYIGSHLLFESGSASAASYDISSRTPPEVSIVIPTFRRPELLFEALASVFLQDAGAPYEIVIVSNDEDHAANQAIVGRLAGMQLQHPLRMYANDRNIGMFPNWNRGIELARGRWVTILNDDDILHAGFLAAMMRRIGARPGIDGIVCKTGFLDRRPPIPQRAATRSFARIAWQTLMRQRFDSEGLTRIGPRQLFFGNEVSNTLGFLLKRDIASELGGFRVQDAPSADYLFYARFGAEHGLYLLDETLADVGIGENESLRTETMAGFMTQGDRLRRAMAGRYVPRRWLRMSPLIVATAVAETNQFWHGRLDPQAIGLELDMVLPAPNRTKLNLLRLLHRAL